MKIAVYTITKNEEQFIPRWAASCKDADYRVIIDTGSTDKTVELAKEHGCIVYEITVKPWRFDDARNASLALLPSDADFCIALDADELLEDGWREYFNHIDPKLHTRVQYKYIWNWNTDGTPGVTFNADKIHARYGYRWKYPVHERLVKYGDTPECMILSGIVMTHHADETKPRSQYLPLLKLAVEEDPLDDRSAHYYARELLFHARYEEAAKEFKRHLSLERAVWKPERARSMRYIAQCLPGEAEVWLVNACNEDPYRRESWYALAKYYQKIESWKQCITAIKAALDIKEPAGDYMTDAAAWGSDPYDVAALASYYLGNQEEALTYGQKAIEISPDNERLADNLLWYMGLKV